MESNSVSRVSIVIASYNHARYIGEAIQSILDQDFQQFEIIITDDCSTDNSPEIIRAFKDPRIKLKVFTENLGPSIAMNDAILRSTGEFIANLGSDDFFLPGKLTKQVGFLDENPNIYAVFGLPKLVAEDGNALDSGLREFSLPFSHKVPTRYEWLRHFFYFGNCLCHPSVLIRKAVHDRLGLYNRKLRALADFDMWVRLCMHGEIYVMADELVGRRVLDNNKNLSARRKDSVIQFFFEFSRILRHYIALSESDLRLIFPDDLQIQDLSNEENKKFAVAQLALRTNREFANCFALFTIFDLEDLDDQRCREFIELSSTFDIFGIFKGSHAEAELQRVSALHINANQELHRVLDLNNNLERKLLAAQTRLARAMNERTISLKEFDALWWRSFFRYPISKKRRTKFIEDRALALLPSLLDRTDPT